MGSVIWLLIAPLNKLDSFVQKYVDLRHACLVKKLSFTHCLLVLYLHLGGLFICLGCQTGKLDVAKKHNLRFIYYYHLYRLAVYITDSYILEGLLAFHCFCCLNPPIQHGVLFCMLRWKLFGLEGGAANMVCCLYFDDAKLQKKR